MKQKLMRLLSLLLCLSLIFVLAAGCSQTAPDTTDDAQTDPSTTTTDEASDKPADTAADTTTTGTSATPANGPAATVELPLVDEPVTFSFWTTGASNYNRQGLETPNDKLAWQAVSEKTNVNFEWELASDSELATQFNLMIVSGSYPDTFYADQALMIGGIESYVEDDVIIDLTDLIEQYAPNYQALRLKDEQTRRDTATDSGRLLCFFNLMDQPQGIWLGPVTQTSWLDESGVGEPESLNDWHEMLTYYKEVKGASIPYGFTANGLDRMIGKAFGLYFFNPGCVVENDTVLHYTQQPAFRDYLEMMNQWYTEGLLDANFYAGEQITNDMYFDGTVGVWLSLHTMLPQYEIMSEDPNFKLSYIPLPVRNDGDKLDLALVGSKSRVESLFKCISTSCKDPITLVKFFDYLCTDEGATYANYGVENVSYTRDEDGVIHWTDEVLDNPTYTRADAQARQTMREVAIRYWWENQFTPDVDERVRTCGDIWGKNWEKSINLSGFVSLSAEEQETYSTIMSDINTYIDENVVRFITGEKPMSEFDSFIETINSMGLEEAIAQQQAAYDRWLNR